MLVAVRLPMDGETVTPCKEKSGGHGHSLVAIPNFSQNEYSLATDGWPNGYHTLFTLKRPSIGGQSVISQEKSKHSLLHSEPPSRPIVPQQQHDLVQ